MKKLKKSKQANSEKEKIAMVREQLSDYELGRLARIEENKRVLESLGLEKKKKPVKKKKKVAPPPPRWEVNVARRARPRVSARW